MSSIYSKTCCAYFISCNFKDRKCTGVTSSKLDFKSRSIVPQGLSYLINQVPMLINHFAIQSENSTDLY